MVQREPVFRAVEVLAKGIVGAQGLRIDYRGVRNIPREGGVVLAVNHTSYVDFLEAGLVARRAGRWPRYMMKAELRRNLFIGFLMKHCKAIGVDREHGAESYHEAVAALESGEAVIVYPEATISRSFELKEFKTGAARMALEADVPIVPIAIWGTQRIWSKGTERRPGRHRYPVVVQVGEALEPHGSPDDPAAVAALTERLRAAMGKELLLAQTGFPAPAGEAWVPARLGGGAPAPDVAAELEREEFAQRRARRAARAAKKSS
ncbi:lysophospholipid acyltransferase family protein [Tsukamurella strandjordii]|uniref:Lysophospholipid acyltransferase family protein n=2 Tax=Tsukamurella strandjordii TaxID=147577 RepID=A0AA90N8Y0_9ACTN|nr:lysophospholipid acyltransferase family protein [Tsukamurella strandjordii]MDP0397937.1 lysophospholipid acyltransferase family protein [Tsukamurella strandjordii]